MKGFVAYIIASVEEFEEELEFDMLKREHEENMRFMQEELELIQCFNEKS